MRILLRNPRIAYLPIASEANKSNIGALKGRFLGQLLRDGRTVSRAACFNMAHLAQSSERALNRDERWERSKSLPSVPSSAAEGET